MFLNHVTYYFVYAVQQHYIRLAVKKQLFATIPETSLTRIEDGQHLRWEEKGKEFYFNGDLYDVVSSKTENGKVTWLCLEDEKETKLLKALARAARSRADHQGKGKKSSYPHFSVDCILDCYEPGDPGMIAGLHQNTFSESRLINSPLEVKGPPPKA